MKLLARLSPKSLALWSIVIFGLMVTLMIMSPGKAAADNGYGCGVNGFGNNQHAAGLIVQVLWVDSSGNVHSDNDSEVKLTTDSPSPKRSINDSPSGQKGIDGPGGIAKMSADDNNEDSLSWSQNFKQVHANCTGMGGDGWGVALGYGKTSPNDGGYNYWALDCEWVSRQEAGLVDSNGNPIPQRFDVTGVGTPDNARSGGYWDTNTISATNGGTVYTTIEYHEPAPPPPQQGTCTYFTTTGSKYVRKEVHITGVSSGTGKSDWNGNTWTHSADFDEYTPAAVGTNVSPGSYQKEWWYTPTSNTINVTVNEWDYDSSTNTWPETTNSYSVSCYSASCSINSVDGDGPGGIVLAGGTMHVHGTFTNTSPPPDSLTMWAGAYLDGPNGTNNLGFIPYAGDPVGFSLDLAAPSIVESDNLSFTPQYNGSESNMSGCSMSVPIYQQFNASLGALTQLKPTEENPYQGADYSTTVSVSETNHAVNIPTSSLFYKKPAGGGQQNIASGSGGTYTAPSQIAFSGHYNIPAGSFDGGDEYCSSIHANYTSGYVGPDNNVVDGTGPADALSCPRIANEPYFKVYNGDISAGGDFDQCTNNGGTLAGFNDISDPTGASRGSSTELSALALIKITGVASAQSIPARSPQNINRSPTDLTFANTGVQVDPTGTESPVLGGDFGGCQTLTNETVPASAKNIALSATSANRATTGAYTHNGNLTITGGTLPVGRNVSMFVNGDVYISGDISYAQSTGWTAGTAPSFVLHATGNIYISPSVKTLSGLYIAQKTNSSATNGKIYTCADTSNHFAPMSASSIYGCNNQLVVYGSFVADQVNLMRTFGSLRDESPNPGSPGSPGTGGIAGVWSCGGGSCNPDLSGYTCIHTNEPGDPNSYTWYDNQLCVPSSSSLKMAWTYYATNPESDSQQQRDLAAQNGNASLAYIQAHGYPYCTPWTPKDASGGVDDSNWGVESGGVYSNQLCLNQNIGLTFGTNPNPPGQACLRVYEPSDPLDNWSSGYYLCAPVSGVTSPTLPSAKGPPFTACSNKASALQQSNTDSCAGEVFEFSPQLYLSNPTITPPGSGSLQFQSITSLPPVL